MAEPLQGFQEGLGWLNNLPNILSGGGFSPESGLGLIMANYGGYIVLGVGVFVIFLGLMVYKGHRSVSDEL
jgi:hypothetical protein